MTTKDVPPGRALTDMAMGYIRGKTLCAAVRLEIADALGNGEQHLDELAVATGSDRDALYRLLRALAGIGVLTEVTPFCFALTPLGQPLRRDVPDSVWASIVFWADLLADSWTYLAECVRAGGDLGALAVMEREGVKSRWSREPDAQAIFHAAFAEPTASDMATVAGAYDFSRCHVVADLGGAGGGLLSAILAAHPEARGILVDRKEAIDGAAARLAAAGMADRCDLVAGDLLEAVPGGADAYIMKSVLHGYNDASARRILTNCFTSMTAESRLLLMEVVLPVQIDRADPRLERLLLADLNMLAVTGGRERSATEWEPLLASAGFELRRVISVPGQDYSILEAVPDRRGSKMQ
ncbi:MAG TPA: methyltransferase [Acidobacteria bacterium]|nr:methyltransferase [Acidobacteriota bacterium]